MVALWCFARYIYLFICLLVFIRCSFFTANEHSVFVLSTRHTSNNKFNSIHYTLYYYNSIQCVVSVCFLETLVLLMGSMMLLRIPLLPSSTQWDCRDCFGAEGFGSLLSAVGMLPSPPTCLSIFSWLSDQASCGRTQGKLFILMGFQPQILWGASQFHLILICSIVRPFIQQPLSLCAALRSCLFLGPVVGDARSDWVSSTSH